MSGFLNLHNHRRAGERGLELLALMKRGKRKTEARLEVGRASASASVSVRTLELLIEAANKKK